MKIDLACGSGGRESQALIKDIFVKHFNNTVLARLEDAAVVEMPAGRVALTTDSFVVTPLFFPGGDIGKIAVCGTVNDLLMVGARPLYLTAGFIIEEGADTEDLERIARSMADAATEAGVQIVAGDTKVIEGRGEIYINTAGIGAVTETKISIANCLPGNALIVSGNLGEHQAALVSARMGITNTIKSDCAPLREMVARLLAEGIEVRALRDITRGGLATVLNELAEASGCALSITEASLPVTDEVEGLCGILGLDPLYMANEGKLLAVVPEAQAARSLELMRGSKYGEHAAIIGRAEAGSGVMLTTRLGGRRLIDALTGEGLPRIC